MKVLLPYTFFQMNSSILYHSFQKMVLQIYPSWKYSRSFRLDLINDRCAQTFLPISSLNDEQEQRRVDRDWELFAGCGQEILPPQIKFSQLAQGQNILCTEDCRLRAKQWDLGGSCSPNTIRAMSLYEQWASTCRLSAVPYSVSVHVM